MARVYQSPPWQHFLSFGIILSIYVYPLFLFLEHPADMLGITRVFILFPLLYLFFLFSPDPDAYIPSSSTRSLIKPLAMITLIDSLFFFISQSITPCFVFITRETPSQIDASLTPEWLALWTLFSLYTGINHYFVHREQKAPLASAALYAGKKSYATIVFVRIFATFASFGNTMLIYVLLSLIMLVAFRGLSHHPLLIGMNAIVMLGFFIIFFLASLFTIRISSLIRVPFRLQNNYYLLIATLLSGIILFNFYHLSLPYLEKPGLVHRLYQAFPLTTACPTAILLSQYALFLLAMPLASGFILRFSKQLRTKTVFILTMAPSMMCVEMGTLPVGMPFTITTTIITMICIFLSTGQKTTADFLMGSFPPPKQRFIVINRGSKLLFSHFIGTISIVLMVLNIGLVPVLGVIVVAGLSLAVITVINIAGFYGRIVRLRRIHFLNKDEQPL